MENLHESQQGWKLSVLPHHRNILSRFILPIDIRQGKSPFQVRHVEIINLAAQRPQLQGVWWETADQSTAKEV